MNGDTYWTVDILLPYYTGETRWRNVHCGESEQLARRMLDAERRAGHRARLRSWEPEVVDADEVYDLAEEAFVRQPDPAIPDSLPF